jgi:hypothetical protein
MRGEEKGLALLPLRSFLFPLPVFPPSLFIFSHDSISEEEKKGGNRSG